MWLAAPVAILTAVSLFPASATAGEWFVGFGPMPGSPEPHPALAMNASGEAALAFAFNGVRVSLRPADGTFEDPEWGGVRVSGESIEGRSPAVAIDARGDVVAMWQQGSPSYQIYEAIRPAGGSFEAPQPVAPATEEPTSPSVAIDGSGETTVAWLGKQAGSTVVRAATSPLGGAFSSTVGLSGTGANAIEPRVLVDPAGKTLVSWGRPGASAMRLEVATRDIGSEFPAPDIHGDGEILGEAIALPSLAIDPAGEAIAAWRTPTGDVATARMPAGSESFNPAVTLGSSSGTPSAAINESGETVIAWPSGKSVQVATAAPASAFGPPAEVPAEFTPNAAHVSIGATGNTAVEWESTAPAEMAQEGTFRSAGGSFAKPRGYGGGPSGPVEGTVATATDSAGDFLGVWGQPDFFYDMKAMLYDAGPQLGPISTPTVVTVGQAAEFSTPTPSSVWAPLNRVTWTFGDGATATGTSVTHAYSSPGTYQVTLAASDTEQTGSALSAEYPELFPEYVSTFAHRTVVVNSTTVSGGPSASQSLSRLSIRPSAFHADSAGPSATAAAHTHHTGATVRFVLARPGRVIFGLERATPDRQRRGKCAPLRSRSARAHQSVCPYVRSLGSFFRSGSAGLNRFRLTGRVHGAKLKPGRYLLLAGAVGSRGAVSRIAFRVLAR